MQIQPYLFFEGRCDEAAAFYREVLGAEVLMRMRYDENPEPPAESHVPPGNGGKIMHMSLRVGETTLMCSDGMCTGQPNFQGFSLTLTPADDAQATTLFTRLCEGGSATMPLVKTFFASSFGMLVDRFGLSWMIMVSA